MSQLNGIPRLTIGGLTSKFKKMAEVYRYFGKDWKNCCDFSDGAMIELYNHESYGTEISSTNGFLVGKKWLNVTVAMWKEDIRDRQLWKSELYEDENLPDWWLDSVLKNF